MTGQYISEGCPRIYIPVRVQDEFDTELAKKCRRYGRSVIVILDGDGKAIFRKRGYQEPQQMLWTLQGVAQDAPKRK